MRHVSALRRRGYAAAANEAVDSLSNFVFAVWVARALHVSEFGAFAVTYSIVQIGIGLCQGVATLPMMVGYAASSRRVSRALAGEVTGAAVVVAIATSAGFVVLALWTLGDPLASCAFAFAVVAPGLLLQNCCVLVFYNREEMGRALQNNVTWLCAQVPLLAVLPWLLGNHHAWVYILAWGLAAYLATIISLVQLAVVPRIDRFAGWIRHRRSSIVDLSVENTVNRASTQIATWALAGEAGLRTTGGVRAAQIPLGLPRIFIVGLAPMGLAEGTRLYARRPRALRALVRWWGLGNTAMCAALGAGLALVPASLGEQIGGDSWHYARPLLVWVVLIAVGNAVLVPAQTGLKCLGATRISAVLRTLTAPLGALGALLGGMIAGGEAAVMGMAAGSLLAGAVAHAVFEREFVSRHAGSSPEAAVLQIESELLVLDAP